jgi:hypothetical protein
MMAAGRRLFRVFPKLPIWRPACQFGAFQRARKVRNVEDLLRLIFLYGPAHLSLRSTAAAADDAGRLA